MFRGLAQSAWEVWLAIAGGINPKCFENVACSSLGNVARMSWHNKHANLAGLAIYVMAARDVMAKPSALTCKPVGLPKR